MKYIQKNRCLFFIAVFFTIFSCVSCAEKEQKKEVQKKEEAEGKRVLYESAKQEFKEIGEIDEIEYICEKDNRLFMIANIIKKKREQTVLLSCNYNGEESKIVTLPISSKGLKETVKYFCAGEKEQFYLLTFAYNKDDKKIFYLKTVDKEGNLITTCELKEKEGKLAQLNVNNAMFITRQGMACLVNGRNLSIFHSDGTLAGNIEFYKGIFDIEFVQLEDGTVYMTNQVPQESLQFVELDLELCEIRNTISIDQDRNLFNIKLCAGTKDIIYIANHGTNVYLMDMSSHEIINLFSWVNSGVTIEDLDAFFVSNEKFFCTQSIWKDDNYCSEMVMVQKKEGEENEKKILRLASALVQNIDDEVILFNEKNLEYQSGYQIEVIDYGEYEDPCLQFQMDITAGNIPDIIDVTIFSPNMYTSKGLFTDLYTLMEQDQEVKKEDFIETVRKTAEIDGKLYYIAPTFYITGLIGSKYRFQDKESLSFSDLETLYESMSEDEVFIHGINREYFINAIVSRSLEQFMDWETGNVMFDSEDFIHMIEFSKKFPKKSHSTGDIGTLVSKDKILLYDESFYDIKDAQFYQKIYQKAGGYTVMGHPSAEGNSNLKMDFCNTWLAISEQCSNKEGAWEFVKQFFTYEYQLQETYHPTDWRENGFPVRNDVLEKELEYALATESYTDQDGTKVIPIDTYSNLGNFYVELGPCSKEETDMVRNWINRIDGFDYYTSTDKNRKEIMKIIQQDMAAYYAGDKTAAEVAEIIQKRVSIYVSEHM